MQVRAAQRPYAECGFQQLIRAGRHLSTEFHQCSLQPIVEGFQSPRRIPLTGMFIEKLQYGHGYPIQYFDAFVQITVHHPHDVMERKPLKDPPHPVFVHVFHFGDRTKFREVHRRSARVFPRHSHHRSPRHFVQRFRLGHEHQFFRRDQTGHAVVALFFGHEMQEQRNQRVYRRAVGDVGAREPEHAHDPVGHLFADRVQMVNVPVFGVDERRQHARLVRQIFGAEQLYDEIPVETFGDVVVVVLFAQRRPQLGPNHVVGRPMMVAQQFLHFLVPSVSDEILDLAERLGRLFLRDGALGDDERNAIDVDQRLERFVVENHDFSPDKTQRRYSSVEQQCCRGLCFPSNGANGRAKRKN